MAYNVLVETRYNTTYTTAMTDTQTTMDVAVAPSNSSGFLTIRYGYPDQEDIYYSGVSGLQLTGLLRGLSPTAITPTEVVGLKRTHDINLPLSLNTVKMTTLHYVINDKASKSGDETITGNWNFTAQPKMTGIKDANGNEVIAIIPTAKAVNYLCALNAPAAVYTPAYLTGGTHAEANPSAWGAITNGSFRFAVDGTTYNVTGIDFTGVASMDDVATKIQTAIRAVTNKTETVTWNTDHFVISSSDTTRASAITVLSAAGVGTDISGAGANNWMDADTGNGVVTNAVFVSRTPVIVSTDGDDEDIDIEVRTKGKGKIAFQDGAKLQTSAPPTEDAQIANKKYVDDVVAGFAGPSIQYLLDKDTGMYLEEMAVGEAVVKEAPVNNQGGKLDGEFGCATAANGVYQALPFRPGSVGNSPFSLTIYLAKSTSGVTDNIYCEIQEDDGGIPSGTVVTNGTSNSIVGNSLALTYSQITFAWASIPTLVPGTRYWAVFKRSGAASDTDYYKIRYTAGFRGYRAPGVGCKAFTTSWGNNTGDDDMFDFDFGSSFSGGIVKAIYNSANSGALYKTMLGLMGETAAIGSTGKKILTRGMLTGLTGLTAGQDYYLSATIAGALSPTQTDISRLIGRAKSSTELMISNSIIPIFFSPCGNGEDGDLFVANGTTTVLNLGQQYNFSSVNIEAGGKLGFTGTTGMATIRCTGDVTIAGTVALEGLNGIARKAFISSLGQVTSGSIAITTMANTGGSGGAGGGSNAAGGNGGSSTAAGDGSGGAGGTGNYGNGGNGSGGNSVTGGGGGGGGGSSGANDVGNPGGSASGLNGGNGGNGASGSSAGGGGAGGGGGGGYNTGYGGNGGNGGNGATVINIANGYNGGRGGNGGNSGTNGGAGGNGGYGGNGGGVSGSTGYFGGSGGNGGNGGDGISAGGNGGDGGAGGIGVTTGSGGNGGNGGNGGKSKLGSGGRGGNGGSGGNGSGGGNVGGGGGNGGDGGDGLNGGNGGWGGNAATNNTGYASGGRGGNGGNGRGGAVAFICIAQGNLTFTGTINARGGNGGNGGKGGNGSGSSGGGGNGGNGGNGGDGADVYLVCYGTLTNSGTINNAGGTGGTGGAGGTGTPNGTAGTNGTAGINGTAIVQKLLI
jgi:hypothetical protein